MAHQARFPTIVVLALAVSAGVLASCNHRATAPSPVTTGAALDEAYTLARQEPHLKSLVVEQNGAVLRQEYFNGGGIDTPQHVWSVTKSVLALTVGAAIDRGCLRSLDQTIGELLGPTVVTDPEKAVITLRHLLTMSSGLDFPELASPTSAPIVYTEWISAPDQVAWVLARPLTAQPGQRFEYGSGTIHLASVALTRACGTSTAALAETALFALLGIPPRTWGVDHQGYTNGATGLELSPRDMQALGNMVLNDGRVQGRPVISSAWIQAMTRTQIATGPGMPTPAYGYGWWIGQVAGAPFALANGWGGQFIMVVPSKRLVVTTAAATDLPTVAVVAQWQRIFDIVTLHVVPSVS